MTQQQQTSGPFTGICDPDPNAVWVATDLYTLSHLDPPTTHNSKILKSTLDNASAQGLPAIYSSRAFAKFLALQAKAINAKHFLEVGTLGGYASIWLASENPSLKVTTLEYNPHHAEVARENIENAGLSDRITVHVGAGMQTLPVVLSDIEAGKLDKFDMVYVDADKMNNWNYVDLAIEGCRKGAIIVVDNVVQGGQIASGIERSDKPGYVSGAREVIEKVGKDERVTGTVIQTVGEGNYDGFLFAIVQ
ncbi:O-methyltransferas-like protein family 3, partial [Aureobasidium melanogenum]|uniref:O-methyltransferas-like protein family 3 n=1 Tax=Aureobasidium melanogenum (strain CBS 110374) TaxID=1043003 RepID=A0A074VXC9_AURM1